MIVALSVALAVLAMVLALPTVSDLVSALAARRGPPPRATRRAKPPRYLILVPAHDEEMLIDHTVRSLQAMRTVGARAQVVVVADNCTDRTAAVAREAGVACLERDDPAHPGKPHAIAWALAQLPLAEFDAMSIIDADCVVDPGYVEAIAAAGIGRAGAAQTYNDVENRGENALTRLGATFAAIRFTCLDPLKQRAGLNVPMGNGLVIGTDWLRARGWEAFSICEDWEMYALLTAAGVRIALVPEARSFVQEARSLGQSASQRQRWAAGKMEVLLHHAPAILRSRVIGWRQKLDAVSELSEPGPVVTLGVALGLAALALLVRVPGAPWVAAALMIPVARLALYTGITIVREPDPWRTIASLAFLPPYLVWRLGVQMVALASVGSRRWTRTARHHRDDALPLERVPSPPTHTP